MKNYTHVLVCAMLVLLAGVAVSDAQEKKSGKAAQGSEKKAKSETPAALNFKMNSLEGKEVDLSKYKGKVVVIVNTASRCGYTRQYENLQNLHEQFGKDGLAILGFPCNQFGGQEPGSAQEIMTFCKKNYGVEFDMFAKVDVKGDKQSKLFKHLTNLDLAPKGKGDVRWNFEKIVLDRTGKPVARFGSGVSPESDKFKKLIKEELAKK